MTRLPRQALRWSTIAALGLAALGHERAAFAHAVGVSSGEYRVLGKVVYGDIGMAGRETARWLPALDADHDGAIEACELEAGPAPPPPALVRGGAGGRDRQA